jgi:acyl carrier protein
VLLVRFGCYAARGLIRTSRIDTRCMAGSMGWLAMVFVAIVFAFAVWCTFAEDRYQRRCVDRFRTRQEQRSSPSKSRFHADPDFQRLCRVLATVAEEAMTPPGTQVDSLRLEPSDTLAEDLAFSLDSLAYANLLSGLEKEFDRKLRWRDFQNAATVEDVYRFLFLARDTDINAC